MDTLARALLVAAAILEAGDLEAERATRYAGWDGELGQAILAGTTDLSALHQRAFDHGEPSRTSGGQERLENLVARYVARIR
jgi:xylose isomerase